MPALLLNDWVDIKIYCQVFPTRQVSINSIYYQVTNVVGGPTDGEAATSLRNAINPVIIPMMGMQAAFWGCTAQISNPPRKSAPVKSFYSNGVAGIGSTNMIPGQVSGLIGARAEVYHTTPGGKSKVAETRMYVPFPRATASLSWGQQDTTYTAQLQTLRDLLYNYVTFTGAAGTATLSPQIRYRDTLNVEARTPVKTTFASQLWATQRRRGDRGQKNILPI